MILVFTHKHYPRLWQMGDFLSQRLNIPVHFTTEISDYQEKTHSHFIWYTPEQPESGHWIPQSGYFADENYPMKLGQIYFPKNQELDRAAHRLAELLDIHPNPYPENELQSKRWVYFPENSEFGFDFFAHLHACLYLTEEKRISAENHDGFGRIPSKHRESVQKGMHLLPMADIAVDYFAQFFQIAQPKISFNIIPTADVDQCFQFKNKSIFKLFGGGFLHPSTLIDRIKWVFQKTDNFTPSRTLKPFLEKHLHSRVFWLKPAMVSNDFISEVITSPTYANIGIHPDLPQANVSLEALSKQYQGEKEEFQSILGDKLSNHSRQHYIFLHPEITYEALANSGITDDWSMGFADTVGFRSGTCKPYTYITGKNQQIIVHSFQIMDVSCKNYLNLNSSQANELGNLFKLIVQNIGGDFCFVVHNESLSGKQGWKSWVSTFQSWSNSNLNPS